MSTECISCGMPMESSAQHAMADVNKPYCNFCARPDGSMQSYEERVEGMAGYMMRTESIDHETAYAAAKAHMSTLPAWKNHK